MVITNATVYRLLLTCARPVSPAEAARLLVRRPEPRHVSRAQQRMAQLLRRGLVPEELVQLEQEECPT